jgi:ABC-2 type transport system permease protein
MRNIWLIIQREYITRVRKKSFLIATFGIPIFMVVVMAGIIYIATQTQEEHLIFVKDDTGIFQDKFRGLDQGETLRFEYSDDSITSIHKFIKDNENSCDGILFIPKLDYNNPLGIKYYGKVAIGLQTEQLIQKAIQEKIQQQRLLLKGLDVQWLDELNKEVSIETIINNEKSKGYSSVASTLGYIMGFLIYLYLIIFGTMVMRGVAEEKTNRIVEVMLSTTKPFDLMMGKIIGIGGVGLTQFILWILVVIIGQLCLGLFFGDKLLALQSLSSSSLQQQNLQDSAKILELVQAFDTIDKARLMFSFLFYFVFGYLFYAAQFAAIGAAVTDEGDTQQYTMPIVLPIIISFTLMSVAIQQPASSAAWWGSMLPFSSPIVMMARIAYGISWGEQLLSMFFLVIGAVAMVFLSARIYRVGVLIQGKKITFKEIGKWMLRS